MNNHLSLEQAPFRVGEKVRLKTGKSPQYVRQVRWSKSRNRWEVICIYESSIAEEIRLAGLGITKPSGIYRRPRDAEDFVLFEETDSSNKEKENYMSDLYEVKTVVEGSTTPRFGTKLTINSKGQYVLEMKGEGGKVEAFSPEDLELVTPYTVGLRNPQNGQCLHIEAVKDTFKTNEVLMDVSNGGIFVVYEIDSKNRTPAKQKRTLVRLQTEKIEVGTDN